MGQIVIDPSALKVAASSLPGRPVYGGPNGGLLDPGVFEVLEDGPDSAEKWQPGDERTRLLVLARESCCDVLFHVDAVCDASRSKRALKQLTVNVCCLMDVVARLLSSLNDSLSQETRQAWPRADRETFKKAKKRLNKVRTKGSVRNIRNKLGAHLDPEVLLSGELRVPPRDLLAALGDSLVLLQLVLNHSRAFAWVRFLGQTDEGSRIVETMFQYPAAVRWKTDANGEAQELDSIFIAADPRHEIGRTIMESVAAYNRMVREFGGILPEIWMRPTDELLAEERGASALSTSTLVQTSKNDSEDSVERLPEVALALALGGEHSTDTPEDHK